MVPTRGGRPPPPPRVLFLVSLAVLAVPVFAHGCHRDDIDHEPGVAPPLRQPEPEARP